MTSSTIPVDTQARRQAQNTFRLGLATAGVMTLVSVASYLSTPNLLGLVVPLPMIVVGLLVAALARSGRARLGAWLLIGVILALTAVGPLTSTGQGFVYAIVSLVMIMGVAPATLPERWMGRLVLPSIAVAVLAVVIDLFGPAGRPEAQNPAVGYLISAGVLLAYVFILARQFPDYPLRTKFILAFVVISLLSAGAVAALANQLVTGRLTEAAGRSLANAARLRANAIGDLLARQVDVLRGGLSLNTFVQDSVAAANAAWPADPAARQAELDRLDEQWRSAPDTDPVLLAYLNNPLSEELREFQRRFQDHAEVFLVDRYGGLVASTHRTSDYFQADEDWWQAAWSNGAGSIYIGQPAYDESSRQWALVMALPVYAHNSSGVVGVLRSTFRLTALNSLLEHDGNGGLASEFDLHLPGLSRLNAGGDPQPAEPELNEALRGPLLTADYVILPFDGELSFVSQAPVRATGSMNYVTALGWRIIAHEHTRTILAPVVQQTRVLALATMAIALLAVAAAAGVAQALTTPILRLTAASQKLAGGDLSIRVPVASRDELGALSRAFNHLTGQLAETVGTLEQRVAERTRALHTSAEVSRRLSSVLDPQQLVVEVVEQLREAFNYYHVHIYLFDEARQNLLMAGGTGEAGRIMLARAHRIAAGRGLVGRAASTGQAVLVPDTAQDPGWLPNPLLPDTQAEAAVPILAGDQVVGVLDVQQNTAGGLAQTDIDLLQSIASQVGIALQNARVYEQTRRQASRDALISAIGQKLQSAATVEQVLKISTEELAQALAARRASASLAAGGPLFAGPKN